MFLVLYHDYGTEVSSTDDDDYSGDDDKEEVEEIEDGDEEEEEEKGCDGGGDDENLFKKIIYEKVDYPEDLSLAAISLLSKRSVVTVISEALKCHSLWYGTLADQTESNEGYIWPADHSLPAKFTVHLLLGAEVAVML